MLLTGLNVDGVPNFSIPCYGAVCDAPFSSGFSPQVRSTVSDFAIFLSIVVMVLIDFMVGIPSPKLHVPHTFKVMGCFGMELVSALGDATRRGRGRTGPSLGEMLVV